MVKSSVILCGGKSSRMNTNKALLPFGEYKLISHQYIKLSKIFKKVFISTKAQQKDLILETISSDLSKYNLDNPPLNTDSIEFLIEESDIFAPIIGIFNSLKLTKAKKLFFISCDSPLVKPKTIEILINSSDTYDITYAKDSFNVHPLVSIWSNKTIDKLENAILQNNFKILQLFESFHTKSIYFDKLEFINLNTKSDYKKALKIIRVDNGRNR